MPSKSCLYAELLLVGVCASLQRESQLRGLASGFTLELGGTRVGGLITGASHPTSVPVAQNLLFSPVWGKSQIRFVETETLAHRTPAISKITE